MNKKLWNHYQRAALNFQFKPEDQAFKPRQVQSWLNLLYLSTITLFQVITVKGRRSTLEKFADSVKEIKEEQAPLLVSLQSVSELIDIW